MAVHLKWSIAFVIACSITINCADEGSPRIMQEKSQDNSRKRRSYYQWRGHTAPTQYESFTRWKSPVYQLSRPYYIPIYGAPGRIPIYYPPQPILINPGTRNMYLPPYNRPVEENPDFKGPPYLPPASEKPPPGIIDKFGMDDDLPVWGNSAESNRTTTRRPPVTRPTRLPRPTGQQTLPPLVHKDGTSGTNQLAAESPPQETSKLLPPSGPSNCVWAIVNCCSVSTTQVVENCFEQRGCPGPFWGKSPCEGDFSRAAIESALNYYNTNA